MKAIHYRDTRGNDSSLRTFTEVIVRGIAPGGGLYVPERIPSLSLEEILAFASWPYWRRAAAVFTQFGVDISPERVDTLMRLAYGGQWNDARVAPVTEVVAGTWMLELWHGPTSAFKDMALQCMPLFFSEAVENQRVRNSESCDYLILVATSGDTGKAALEGFAGRDHTQIVVFYPAEGVSEIQRLQMVTQTGSNVGVFAVEGNFDDCQSSVKAAFGDSAFTTSLAEQHNIVLSSANSINWGRLLPQIAYYVSAYADMVAAGGVQPGKPIDVCVPTGNFGNILGAYFAKRMGVPIGRMIVASNENRVLTDFVATGLYDIGDRHFVTTPSPSMDILISSNLERFLFETTSDPELVAGWMRDLSSGGSFQVDPETFAKVRDAYGADYVSNEESLETIRRLHAETGTLIDPHTAVAWEVAERLRGDNPMLVVSTAHWAKFGIDVYKALTSIPYAEPLPDEVAEVPALELLKMVEALAGDHASRIPDGLLGLAGARPRFDESVGSGCAPIEDAVLRFLSR
jgi:threonine synthase